MPSGPSPRASRNDRSTRGRAPRTIRQAGTCSPRSPAGGGRTPLRRACGIRGNDPLFLESGLWAQKGFHHI
jgi:hypothetical protein